MDVILLPIEFTGVMRLLLGINFDVKTTTIGLQVRAAKRDDKFMNYLSLV